MQVYSNRQTTLTSRFLTEQQIQEKILENSYAIGCAGGNANHLLVMDRRKLKDLVV